MIEVIPEALLNKLDELILQFKKEKNKNAEIWESRVFYGYESDFVFFLISLLNIEMVAHQETKTELSALETAFYFHWCIEKSETGLVTPEELRRVYENYELEKVPIRLHEAKERARRLFNMEKEEKIISRNPKRDKFFEYMTSRFDIPLTESEIDDIAIYCSLDLLQIKEAG